MRELLGVPMGRRRWRTDGAAAVAPSVASTAVASGFRVWSVGSKI